jgi:hypothetical protein
MGERIPSRSWDFALSSCFLSLFAKNHVHFFFSGCFESYLARFMVGPNEHSRRNSEPARYGIFRAINGCFVAANGLQNVAKPMDHVLFVALLFCDPPEQTQNDKQVTHTIHRTSNPRAFISMWALANVLQIAKSPTGQILSKHWSKSESE